MLNEEFADRTLPPTERRRREARMRGQVPRSADLTSALLLLAASGALWFIAPIATNSIARFMRRSITIVPQSSLTIDATVELMQSASWIVATIVVPIVLVVMTVGIVANLAQTGWLWLPSTIVPRFRSGSLISEDSTAKGAAAALRLGALFCVAIRFVSIHDAKLFSVGLDEPMGMLVRPAQLLGELSVQLAFTLLLVAMADYGFRFWRNEQRLKMTVEERRQEQRDEAVDPHVRKRRADIGHRRKSPMPLSEIGRFEATSR